MNQRVTQKSDASASPAVVALAPAPALTSMEVYGICRGTSPSDPALVCENVSTGQLTSANLYGAGPKVYVGILEIGYGYGPTVKMRSLTVPSSALVETANYCESGGLLVECGPGDTIVAFGYWYDVTSQFLPYPSNGVLTAHDSSMNAPYNAFNISFTVRY